VRVRTGPTASIGLAWAALMLGACSKPPASHADPLPAIVALADTGAQPEPATQPLSSCHEALLAASTLGDDAAIWSHFALAASDPAVRVDLDRPLRQQATDLPDASRCLIRVGRAELMPSPPRRVISERTLRSSFVSGTKRAPNPDYVEQEEDAEDGTPSLGRFLKTGDPTVDLIGVLAEGVVAGLGAFRTDDDAADSPPKTVDVDRLVPYSYSLSELEAGRAARLPIALHDRLLDASHSTTVELNETKLFALTDDRHPNDPQLRHDPASQLITSVQLERWEAGIPQVRASTLIDHLRHAVLGEPGSRLRIAERPADPWSVEPAAGYDGQRRHAPPASAGWATPMAVDDAIRLVDDDSGATGFYVDPQHLIVPAGALPATSLVPLSYPDGKLVYGLLHSKNPQSGLALVFTPRNGEPLALADVALEPGPDPGMPSGLPMIDDGRVVGVWVGPTGGGRHFVTGATIAKLTRDARLN